MFRGRAIPLVVPVYLLAAWPAFLLTHENAWVHANLGYRIPDLTGAPLRALGTFVTAPLFNHAWDQLIYATVLLVLFGLFTEWQVGIRRTAIAFVSTQLAAAMVAGTALHLIYPAISDADLFEEAWNRTYTGASAGAVGLYGLFATRRRWPLAFLLAFVTWELAVWWVYLENYTPAFHLTALFTGFCLGTWAWPLRRVDRGDRGTGLRSRNPTNGRPDSA